MALCFYLMPAATEGEVERLVDEMSRADPFAEDTDDDPFVRFERLLEGGAAGSFRTEAELDQLERFSDWVGEHIHSGLDDQYLGPADAAAAASRWDKLAAERGVAGMSEALARDDRAHAQVYEATLDLLGEALRAAREGGYVLAVTYS